MSVMSKDELVALIEQAFADVPYPGDRFIDNPDWDTGEIFRAFQGKNWKELTDIRFLRNRNDSLRLSHPESFRFYLPAFMLAVLKDPETADVILDLLVSQLYPPDAVLEEYWRPILHSDESLMSKFLRKVSGLNRVQAQAIYEYLQFYYHTYPDGYWDHLPEKIQREKDVLAFWETFEG